MESHSTNELWSAWRAAETALARDPSEAGLEAAEESLPERLRWYFRAMALTLRGEGDALKALAPKAPHRAARALAETASEEPRATLATEFRASLKRMGVANEPFPMLDLMRLYKASKNREGRPRPKKIVAAAEGRPMLDAALTTLSETFRHVDRRAELVARSMHAALAWKAEDFRYDRAEGIAHQVAAEFEGAGPELGQWQIESWVDLDPPAFRTPDKQFRGKAGLGLKMIYQFIGRPSTSVWTTALTQETFRLRSVLPQSDLERLTGCLLEAAHEALRAGRLSSGRGAVQGAMLLLTQSLLLPGSETLRIQLTRLYSTLNLLGDEPDSDGALFLWRRSREIAFDDRIAVATTLANGFSGDAIGNADFASLLAHALLGDAPAPRKRQWLSEFGMVLSFAQCESALEDVGKRWLSEGGDARKLALWRGWLLAALGSPANALPECLQLLELGDSKTLAEPLVACLTESVRQPEQNRQLKRQLQRTLATLGNKITASEHPDLSLVYFGYLAGMLASSKAVPSATLALFRDAAKAESSDMDGGGGADLFGRLRLAMLIGERDLAANAYKAMGRWMRKASAAESIPAALTIVAECTMYEELDSGWFCKDDTAEARGRMLPLGEWLKALTAFLDRHPTETVGKAALELHSSGTVTGHALLIWYDDHSELESSRSWEMIAEAIEGDDDDEAGLQAILDEMSPEAAASMLDLMMGMKGRR